MQTQGEHANRPQKGPDPDLNPGPSSCEATLFFLLCPVPSTLSFLISVCSVCSTWWRADCSNWLFSSSYEHEDHLLSYSTTIGIHSFVYSYYLSGNVSLSTDIEFYTSSCFGQTFVQPICWHICWCLCTLFLYIFCHCLAFRCFVPTPHSRGYSPHHYFVDKCSL